MAGIGRYGVFGSGPDSPLYVRVGWISTRRVSDLKIEKRTLTPRASLGSLAPSTNLQVQSPEGLFFEEGRPEKVRRTQHPDDKAHLAADAPSRSTCSPKLLGDMQRSTAVEPVRTDSKSDRGFSDQAATLSGSATSEAFRQVSTAFRSEET